MRGRPAGGDGWPTPSWSSCKSPASRHQASHVPCTAEELLYRELFQLGMFELRQVVETGGVVVPTLDRCRFPIAAQWRYSPN